MLEKKRPNKIVRCLEEVRKLVSYNVNDVNNMNDVNPLNFSGSKTRTGPRSGWTLSSGTSSTPDDSNTKLDKKMHNTLRIIQDYICTYT